MLTDKYISVVVVCYKDEGGILELLRRVKAILEKITLHWEIIYVNDDSPDNSEAVLQEEVKKDARLTVISHARNFGAQVAFTTGLLQASGDAVVIMDGDLQDPPELIEDFVKFWIKGYDVVYGIRAKRNEGMVRNIGYRLFYKVFKKIAYIVIPLDAGEFSLMDRVVVDVIISSPERDRLIRGLRAYAGFKQIGIKFERPSRFAGESTQSLISYIMWVIKSFTSFSLFPLRLITFLGFINVGIFFLLMVYYVIAYFLVPSTPRGFMTLLCLFLGFGAMIMLSLSIIGEYVGRLFIEIKQRPQPVIRLLLNEHRQFPRSWLGRRGDYENKENIKRSHEE